MSDHEDKRSRNDERRVHIERRTGEKHKYRIQELRTKEAQQQLKDFCFTGEEHPDGSDSI